MNCLRFVPLNKSFPHRINDRRNDRINYPVVSASEGAYAGKEISPIALTHRPFHHLLPHTNV
jgi:hypothetical protein